MRKRVFTPQLIPHSEINKSTESNKKEAMDYITIVLVALLAITSYHGFKTFSSRKNKKLPPGPRALPIIGHLHLLGSHFHQSLAELAKTYGPIMLVKLGQLNTLVISSPAVARQVLQKQDTEFSSKWIPRALHAHNQYKYSVVLLPVESRFRSIRKAMNSTIFSGTRLDAALRTRSRKMQELIDYCQRYCEKGEAVNIGLAAFMTTLNLLTDTIFSKNVMDPNSDSVQQMRDVMWNVSVEAGAPNLADFYKFLKFDIQGITRRLTNHFSKVFEIFMTQIDERMEQRKLQGPTYNDALDLLLNFIEENPKDYDRVHMERMFLDLFIAGSDTTSSTLEWGMAEVLKSPEVLKKAKEELAQVIGKGKPIEEPDVDRLPYLQCIVKETLRLHPPVQTLIPRMVYQDVELCGYSIPKGTKVLVNAWAIGRDPSYWENPLVFKPERFWNSDLDVRGLDFELIPFGSGRRICPGMPLARRILPTMLGTLLNAFDWKLDGGIKPEELNMEEKVGLVLQKKYNLKAIPIPL